MSIASMVAGLGVVILATATALTSVCAPAMAAAAAPPQSYQPQSSYQLPPVANPGGDMKAAVVHVEQVVFRGNRVLRTSALQSVAEPYLRRELSAGDIEELRVALTHQYVDRGYINSGVVLDPAAPYHDGILSFQVIEGRITQVRVHGLKRLRPFYVVNRLRPDDTETLNTTVLRERFQHLLDDPLFARVNSRIEPGSQPGESLLDVNVERARPYSLALALNNYRPPSIGEKAYDLSGEVRNLTGLGDWLDVDLTGALKFTGGVGYNLAWQIPFNHYGSFVSLSTARAETVVTEEPLDTLDIRSTIERYELRVTQPLWRSPTQQLNLSASFAREKDATTLLGEPFSFLPGAGNGVTRSNTLRVIPDYSYRSERQYWGLRVTLLRAYLLDYPSEPTFYAIPDKQYLVWTAQLHQLWEMPRLPLELETHATLQRTSSRISDLHALEIGGINSVRGYRENELLAADVENFNIDLRWLVLPVAQGLRPSVTVGTFFDWAAGHDVGADTNTLSSVGVTWRLKWTHLQADFAYGARLVHPSFVNQEHGAWQDHGIHAQIATIL